MLFDLNDNLYVVICDAANVNRVDAIESEEAISLNDLSILHNLASTHHEQIRNQLFSLVKSKL